jgi:hypothetical protein
MPIAALGALAGQVPGCASLVGLVHRDVQTGVADRFPGGGEAVRVAKLGEDRDRG